MFFPLGLIAVGVITFVVGDYVRRQIQTSYKV